MRSRRKYRARGPTNPFPREVSTFPTIRPFTITYFRMSTDGPAEHALFVSFRAASVLLSREYRKPGDKAVRRTAGGRLLAGTRRLGLRRQGISFSGGAKRHSCVSRR